LVVGALFVAGFALVQIDSRPAWVVPLVLGSIIPIGLVAFVLPMSVRCRVCGLHMESSSAARTLPNSERLSWLETLEACPVCGDDGRATAASRSAWNSSGGRAEQPYWSVRRMLVGLLVAASLLSTALFIGSHVKP